MKEIFEHIKGREWDKTQHLLERVMIEDGEIVGEKVLDPTHTMTLADLLANKSWAVAVWGEEIICNTCEAKTQPKDIKLVNPPLCVHGEVIVEEADMAWIHYSLKSLKILQTFGEKECILYIKKTMV